MKKTVYENLEVFGIATFLIILIYTFTGAGFWGVVDAVTDCVIFTALILMISDVCFKFNRYRRLLCWEYWVGFALEFACVSTFAFASRTPSVLAMYLGLVGTIAIGVGIYFWDAKVYNLIEFDENNMKITEKEVINKKSKKAFKKEVKALREVQKAFPTMEPEQIKESLYRLLKYRFVDDDITNSIKIDKPLSDNPVVGTYKELSELGSEYNSAAIAVKEYVDDVVRQYVENKNK